MTREQMKKRIDVVALGAFVWLAAGCGVPADGGGDQAAQDVAATLSATLGADGRSGCTVDIDGGGACRAEADWGASAEKICPARGQVLVAYKAFDGCGAGKYRRVAYACCAAPAPPPDPSCKDIPLGDGTSCLSSADWKAKATVMCAGLSLTALKTSNACGADQYRAATATCCVPATPPPPPPCTPDKLGDGTTCLDVNDWKLKATATCSAKGQTLGDFKPAISCGASSYTVVAISCCGSSGGGGGTPACFAGAIGGAGTCADQKTLQAQAEGICATKSYRLSNFAVGGACAVAGNYTTAKYECCP